MSEPNNDIMEEAVAWHGMMHFLPTQLLNFLFATVLMIAPLCHAIYCASVCNMLLRLLRSVMLSAAA